MANVKIIPMSAQPEEDSVQAYKNKLALAQALMNQDMPNAVYKTGTGALLAGSKMLGGFLAGQADRKEKQDEEDAWNPLKAMVDASVAGFNTGGGSVPSMAGGDGGDVPSFDMPSGGSNEGGKLPTFAGFGGTDLGGSDMARFAEAIKGNESGGRYGVLGPVTKGGDRAYGAYQVMGKNIPSWTQEALGKALTPQDFLKNPQAQDAVFAHRFGGYVQKYGNPYDAASAWFSGRPMAQAGNAKDVLGTTVPAYVRKFATTLNGLPSGAPQGSPEMQAAEAPQAEIAGQAGTNTAAGGDNLTAPIPVTRLPAVQPPDFSTARQKMLMAQQMLRNPRTRSQGFQLWQQGMAEAQSLQSQYLTSQREMAVKQAELALKEREFGANETDRTSRRTLEREKFAWEKTKPTMAGRDQRVITIDPATGQPRVAIEAAPPLPPAEAQAAEYYRQNPEAFDVAKQLKAAGRPNTQVNVGGGTDKQIFDTMKESATAARSAVTGLRAIREARKAVEGGGIFGAGADVRLGFAKLGALFGGDPSQITNTETFRSVIAPQVASLMKATVGSTQISNADREFAEKAAGGSITLEPTTIKRLLGIMEKASNVVVSEHTGRLDQVYPDGGNFGRERSLFGVAMPPDEPAEPQGREWQNPDQTQTPPPPPVGTIMDGHRFKGGNPADEKNWERLK